MALKKKKRKPLPPIEGKRAEKISAKNDKLRKAIFDTMDAIPLIRDDISKKIHYASALGFAEKQAAATDAAISVQRFHKWLTKEELKVADLTSMLYLLMFGDKV